MEPLPNRVWEKILDRDAKVFTVVTVGYRLEGYADEDVLLVGSERDGGVANRIAARHVGKSQTRREGASRCN